MLHYSLPHDSTFPMLTGDETLRGLSVQAAQKALEMAQVKAEDVNVVILCTSTPDDLFGGAAQVLCDTHLSISTLSLLQ